MFCSFVTFYICLYIYFILHCLLFSLPLPFACCTHTFNFYNLTLFNLISFELCNSIFIFFIVLLPFCFVLGSRRSQVLPTSASSLSTLFFDAAIFVGVYRFNCIFMLYSLLTASDSFVLPLTLAELYVLLGRLLQMLLLHFI